MHIFLKGKVLEIDQNKKFIKFCLESDNYHITKIIPTGELCQGAIDSLKSINVGDSVRLKFNGNKLNSIGELK